MVAMRCERGLAFRSPLHARALPNLQERALKAMRSVGRFRGTLDTVYERERVFRFTCRVRTLSPPFHKAACCGYQNLFSFLRDFPSALVARRRDCVASDSVATSKQTS